MSKLALIFITILSLATCAFAQSRAQAPGTAQSETQAQASRDSIALASGTQLSAELLTTLDAKRAKPGDEFQLRTIKPVIVNRQRVIPKGATLIGRVTEASRAVSTALRN
jgi:hypothetical protein